ncbi:hypothetical protein [Reyranella sp.]|uniref:hypothetical protein n=1 Tax=Reyranella sp. TaxID=1929291 RepID=UPI003784F874
MPLQWTIDHDLNRVVATADGDVTRAEFEAFLDAIERENAMAYCKLFDGAAGGTRMGTDDVLAICVRIRDSHRTPVGPLAIVVPPEMPHLVPRVLGVLAAAKRPMKIFHSLKPAQRWFDSLDCTAVPAFASPAPTGE